MCPTMRRTRSRKFVFSLMARPHFTRGSLFSSLLIVALSACAGAQQPGTPAKAEPVPVIVAPVALPPPPAPVRVAPTRPEVPRLWPTSLWRGAEYIDVRDIARRFGLKAEWAKSGPIMTIADRNGTHFVFEEKQRDFHFDGMRVFLGESVIREKDSLWLSKIDVIKIVAPLYRPIDHVAMLPAVAPKLIVIDPGHGGSDPGKENKTLGLNEKTFTLDVAHRLKKLLETQGWRVLLTRSDDRELSPSKKTDLQLRDDLANKNRADIFLSIHFNSVEKDTDRVTGVETYTMTPQYMFSSGGEKKDDMTNVAYPGNRLDYGNLLLGEQLHRAMITTLKTPDRGFKRARWGVLRMLDCPGALVECAYLSSNSEARRIATPEFRQQIAQALAAGLQNYSVILETLHPKPVEPENINPAVVLNKPKETK